MADKMTVDSSVFQLPISITANGTVEKTLQTKDTYVDKNIKVTITTPDATFEQKDKGEGHNGEISATASLATSDYLSADETPYAITAQADAHVNDVTVGTKVAGFTAADDTITVAAADATKATKTAYIKAGSLSGADGGAVTAEVNIAESAYLTDTNTGYAITATADASSAESTTGVATAGWIPTTAKATVKGQTATQDSETKYIVAGALKAGEGSAAATGTNIAITASDTQPTSGAYITVTGSGSTGVATAGWIPTTATQTSDTATKYYSVTAATLKNSATEGKSYTEIDKNSNENIILVSGDYLYIDGGAIGDTKISLATLVPDDATITETATGKSDMMRSISAYDKDGKLIAGSMPDAVIASTKGADGTVKPVVEVSTENNNASIGTLTTTKPSSGNYIAVDTSAITASTTVNTATTTTGYATAGTTKSEITVDRGAEASDVAYIPLTAATHSDTVGEISVVNATATASTTIKTKNDGTVAGVLDAAPAEGDYLKIDGTATQTTAGSVSGDVTCATSVGYVGTAINSTKTVSGAPDVTITDSATKYIKIYDGSIL